MLARSFNPLDYPICFTQPTRQAPSTWTSHVPFAMFLVQLLRPGTIVELGSYYGVSHCAFCQAVSTLKLQTKCFAIDTWQGDEQSGFFGDNVYNDLKQFHDPLYGSFSTLIRSTFDEAVTGFNDGSIDLLHIDGYHTYEAVKHDFDTWLPKVSKSGIILFHDIHMREKDFGVWRLWDELRSRYPSFEFKHGYGLGIIAVSNEYPKDLDILLKLNSAEVLLVQEFFQGLGQSLENQYERSRLENLLENDAKQNQELRAQLSAWETRWAVLQGTAGWRLLQKAQALRQELFSAGSLPDRLLQTVLAFRLLGKEAPRTILGYLTRTLKKSVPQNVEVSIVIPVFNLIHLTQVCLDSIYRETKSRSFEVIVIDNASMDATPRWLIAEKMRKENLIVLSQKRNIGFGPAINKGIQQSKGRFVVLLNNDTIVAPGWLERMIGAMDKDPSIGIVSPVTNYVGDGLQKDKEAVQLDSSPDAISQYASKIANKTEILYEANRLVFFCVMLRREVIDKVGYIDTNYETGNFEDDDYCFRTIVAGFRLAIATNAFVYHLGSATFSGNNIPHAQLMERNSQKFYKSIGKFATSEIHFPAKAPRMQVVSVILRTMNRSATLQNALMSLVNQTYKDFEVVVVNDGGEDIRDQLSLFQDHLTITYICHETNKGRSAAANSGLRVSKGKWITFLDDDDILYPWHLESLVQAGEMSGDPFIYSDFNRGIFSEESIDEPSLINTPPSWEFNVEDLKIMNHIPINCWLLSRKCIDEIGQMDESLDMLEDYNFLLRLLGVYSFHHLSKVTCEYRFYQKNMNSVFTQLHKTLQALEVIYQRYPASDPGILKKRAQTVESISRQIEEVSAIIENSGSLHNPEEANRRIIQVVLGL